MSPFRNLGPVSELDSDPAETVAIGPGFDLVRECTLTPIPCAEASALLVADHLPGIKPFRPVCAVIMQLPIK
jgi:hypothetical protein